MLNRMYHFESVNKMGSANLAIVFGPNLLRHKEANIMVDIQDSSAINELIRKLIENYAAVFE
jgi:hypothetical protein